MTISTWRSCIIATATTAVAVGAFLGGCGSTATSSGSSQKGDSCASSFDCADGLACIENVCGGTTVTPEDGGQTQTDGGGKQDTGTTPPGKDGGKDSAPASDTGTGPETATSAGLSALGERCGTTTDCASGLVCINTEEALGGICDLESFGLKPSAGAICGGQCVADTDCYELPVGNPTGYTACADLLAGGLAPSYTATCGTAVETDPVSQDCFFYKTYCLTTSKSWTCNTSNECTFTAACIPDNDNDGIGGCATKTRTGETPVNGVTCDATAKKCVPGTVATTPICKTAADCATNVVTPADTPASVVCTGTECTCFESNCYLKCNNDLDCAAGLTCNATSHLCQEAAGCSSDADCAFQLGNVKATCGKSGTCGIACTNDHDCSPSSGANLLVRNALGAFSGDVCDTGTGLCEPVNGCTPATTPDPTCQPVGMVPTFCVKPTTVAAITAVHSAITSP